MWFRKKLDFKAKHVFITGGSSGIGYALAVEALKRKANVTIAARTLSTLETAVEKLKQLAEQLGNGSKVQLQAVDVCDEEKVKGAINAAQQTLGPIDILICCAGFARPGYFHELDKAAFRTHMEVNYYGVLNTVHAAYRGMVSRNSGHICLVGSALSLFGMVGYSAYCPSKYAVKGLADCLRNELQGTGVTVSMAYPPDTQTPGFESENQYKPVETAEISAAADLFKPEQVAATLVKGMERGEYQLPTPDFGIQLHSTLVKGFVPRRFPGVMVEMLAGCFGPLIHWFYVSAVWDRISRKHAKRRFAGVWAGGEAPAPAADAAAQQ